MKKSFVIKCIAVFVAIGLVGLPTVGNANSSQQVVDEGWVPNFPQGVLGRQLVTLMDKADYFEMASVLRGYPVRSTGGFKSCTSLQDPNCSGVEKVEFGALLSPCSSATSLNCIAEFGVVRNDGTKVPAVFERNFPAIALNEFPADESRNLPAGKTGSLWNVPGSESLDYPLHYVRVSVGGKANSQGVFEFADFAASVTPVSMRQVSCEPQLSWSTVLNPCTPGDYPETRSDRAGYSGFVENIVPPGLDCIMSGNPNRSFRTAECAYRRVQSSEVRYYMSVRLRQSPQGWLHGRLANAAVDIAAIAEVSGAVTISVQGSPVRVPVIQKDMAFADLPAPLKDAYTIGGGGWPTGSNGTSYYNTFGLQDLDPQDGTKRNRNSSPPSFGPNGIAELEAWMPYVNDQATADRTTWSLRTLSSWEREQANPCLVDKSRVTGLVFTNATQYLAGAPEYNFTRQSLDYKVSAPHLMSNGEPFKGSYELLIRDDVARCIYGFGRGELNAEVTVSGQDPLTTLLTGVTQENGWLRFTAAGFTHSSPVIRTAIKQKPVQTRTKVRQSLSSQQLVKLTKLKRSKSSKVRVKATRKSAKVCRVQSGAVRTLRRVTCQVSVTVTTGKRKATRTVVIKVR